MFYVTIYHCRKYTLYYYYYYYYIIIIIIIIITRIWVDLKGCTLILVLFQNGTLRDSVESEGDLIILQGTEVHNCAQIGQVERNVRDSGTRLGGQLSPSTFHSGTEQESGYNPSGLP